MHEVMLIFIREGEERINQGFFMKLSHEYTPSYILLYAYYGQNK